MYEKEYSMNISFVTGNKGKYEEVREILGIYKIEVEHINQGKPEIDSDNIKEIATYSAQTLAKQLQKIIVIEDTGLYFHAFNNFPGTRPKFVYKGIGLEGCLKLLKGLDREAHFVTVAAIGWPNGKVELFEGTTQGKICEEINGKSHPQLPFDSIFIPKGYDKTFAEILTVKKKLSHRRKAFEKLGEHLCHNGTQKQ